MRRKAHAVTSGRYAFKDIASVFLGLYHRNDRIGGIQQLDGHIHAVAFFLAEAGVGVVVIVDMPDTEPESIAPIYIRTPLCPIVRVKGSLLPLEALLCGTLLTG